MLKTPLCDLCGNHHHFTDDGFQYLDCYWYQRSKDTKLGWVYTVVVLDDECAISMSHCWNQASFIFTNYKNMGHEMGRLIPIFPQPNL